MNEIAPRRLPAALRASLPPELRGRRRDQVPLLVLDRSSRTLTHTRFDHLGQFLHPGDLLVVNSSRTLPAALPARRESGEAIQLRLCVRRGETWDVLAVQPVPPHENVALRVGEAITLNGSVAGRIEGRRADIPLLWRLRAPPQGLEPILCAGEPIRYSYVPHPVPLDYYQTVYATHPGSAETPSAGRAFTWELLLSLRRRGVSTAEIVLHTGLSSFQDDTVDAEQHLFEEWFEVRAEAAEAVNSARRVIAVGTTVVRALETARDRILRVRPLRGWTNLLLGPRSRLGAVDALLTGFHEPQTSHFDLLGAFVGMEFLRRAYAEAVDRGYLWHEFGDLMLIV